MTSYYLNTYSEHKNTAQSDTDIQLSWPNFCIEMSWSAIFLQFENWTGYRIVHQARPFIKQYKCTLGIWIIPDIQIIPIVISRTDTFNVKTLAEIAQLVTFEEEPPDAITYKELPKPAQHIAMTLHIHAQEWLSHISKISRTILNTKQKHNTKKKQDTMEKQSS